MHILGYKKRISTDGSRMAGFLERAEANTAVNMMATHGLRALMAECEWLFDLQVKSSAFL